MNDHGIAFIFEGPMKAIIISLKVSTRAVIGQFSGPYSPVRTAKI